MKGSFAAGSIYLVGPSLSRIMSEASNPSGVTNKRYPPLAASLVLWNPLHADHERESRVELREPNKPDEIIYGTLHKFYKSIMLTSVCKSL